MPVVRAVASQAVRARPPRPVALLFPGQGAQHAGMARGLYGRSAEFTGAVDEVFGLMGGEGARVRADWAAPRPRIPIDDVRRSQPLLFAVGYGLGRLLLGWGVRPAALLGHSAGELVAATLAGVMDLPDAVLLLSERVRHAVLSPAGGMLALSASLSEALPYTGAYPGGEVALAAVNAERRVMLSGPDRPLEEAAARLRRDGYSALRVAAAKPFHSPAMAKAAEATLQVCGNITLRPSSPALYSGYTGGLLDDDQARDPAFWAGQLTRPVRFWPALDELLAADDMMLIEAGPGRHLTLLARSHPAVRSGASTATPLLPARPGPPGEDPRTLLKAAVLLRAEGHTLSPTALETASGRAPHGPDTPSVSRAPRNTPSVSRAPRNTPSVSRAPRNTPTGTTAPPARPPMKALILAGGSGTRLRPFSYSMPKQLMPVGNTPVLSHALANVRALGVRDVALVVGDREAEIRAALGDGSGSGVRLTYLRQERPLGLAHAVALARPFLGDDDFVMYLGDNMLPGGIAEAAADFHRRRPAAQILVRRVADPRAFGVAELGPDGVVARLVEKPTHPVSDLAVLGVYFFTPAVHDAVAALRPSARGELEITDALQSLVDAGHQVRAREHLGYWRDVGRAQDVLDCNRQVLAGLAGEVLGEVDAHSLLIGPVRVEAGARVARSRIVGPAIVGAGSVVEDSEVGPYTSIGEACVLASAGVEGSVVLAGASVRGVRSIQDSLIGRDAVVSAPAAEGSGHRFVVGDHTQVEVVA